MKTNQREQRRRQQQQPPLPPNDDDNIFGGGCSAEHTEEGEEFEVTVEADETQRLLIRHLPASTHNSSSSTTTTTTTKRYNHGTFPTTSPPVIRPSHRRHPRRPDTVVELTDQPSPKPQQQQQQLSPIMSDIQQHAINNNTNGTSGNSGSNDDKNNQNRDYGGGDGTNWIYEWRHSPCLMQPTTMIMFFIFGLFMFITLVFQLPGLVLGLILGPILQRSAWYIEFLYPLPIGRWAHFLLMKASSSSRRQNNSSKRKDDKNRGFHSRTIEQRVEVVPGRVYIHPLPQWLDNVGYLIVCLPPPSQMSTRSGELLTSMNGNDEKPTATVSPPPIVALIIDCGDCSSVVRAIELISEYHYNNRPIHIQSIASTHKHHDHTGGNQDLLQHETFGKTITRVYGGAVERVPCCTDHLVDGQRLVLPNVSWNDMNELVEMEAIGVPAHTRGSLVYRLRCKNDSSSSSEFLFTGDTIFSGGSGVPFESDVGIESEKQLAKSNGNTFVHGNLGTPAMERCFSEVMSRAIPNDDSDDVCSRIVLFPGHEYTQDLLLRQFQHGSIEQGRWKNLPPQDFFQTVSSMYTAFHRRSLPQNSGNLLTIPTTLQRELHINTHFRSLRRSAQLVVRAVVFWYDHFCKEKLTSVPQLNGQQDRITSGTNKTPSTIKRWNLDTNDIDHNVFTTVYTSDLEKLLHDLKVGKLSNEAVAEQLLSLTRKMEEPTVNKRAIPGFMPSDKTIYRGICALSLLGSKPTAMTISDSRTMNLPMPVRHNSDKILVSQKRLTVVLRRLGMLRSPSGEDVSFMIHQLWKEANQVYCHPDEHTRSTTSDVESIRSTWRDEVELGVLKWILYGVQANQPSWMYRNLCMPCSSPSSQFSYVFPQHPASKMNKKSGELVSHDVLTCNLCSDATGNIQLTDDDENGIEDSRMHSTKQDMHYGGTTATTATTCDAAGNIQLRLVENASFDDDNNNNLEMSNNSNNGEVISPRSFRARSSLKEAVSSNDSWNDQGVQEWEDLAETIVKQASQKALG